MTAKSKVQSIEPNIADMANSWLKSYELDYKLEQESLNTEIDQALNDYFQRTAAREETDLMLSSFCVLMTGNIIPFLLNIKVMRTSLLN